MTKKKAGGYGRSTWCGWWSYDRGMYGIKSLHRSCSILSSGRLISYRQKIPELYLVAQHLLPPPAPKRQLHNEEERARENTNRGKLDYLLSTSILKYIKWATSKSWSRPQRLRTQRAFLHPSRPSRPTWGVEVGEGEQMLLELLGHCWRSWERAWWGVEVAARERLSLAPHDHRYCRQPWAVEVGDRAGLSLGQWHLAGGGMWKCGC